MHANHYGSCLCLHPWQLNSQKSSQILKLLWGGINVAEKPSQGTILQAEKPRDQHLIFTWTQVGFTSVWQGKFSSVTFIHLSFYCSWPLGHFKRTVIFFQRWQEMNPKRLALSKPWRFKTNLWKFQQSLGHWVKCVCLCDCNNSSLSIHVCQVGGIETLGRKNSWFC